MGQEDFMGPEGRVLLFQAHNVQTGKIIPSTENSLCKGRKKEYGVSMHDKESHVTGVEICADMEPRQVRLDKQAEAIRGLKTPGARVYTKYNNQEVSAV